MGYYNLGVTLRELGKLYDSEVSYREAIKLKPKYSEAYNNLGIVLRELGKLDDSEATFKKAIELKPNYADAYHNLSFTLLQKSDFKQAFELYEWRWKTEGENEKKLASSKPIWKGENNSRIYIWKEQGIGDEIMFCSILPEMKDLTNKLIINCTKKLSMDITKSHAHISEAKASISLVLSTSLRSITSIPKLSFRPNISSDTFPYCKFINLIFGAFNLLINSFNLIVFKKAIWFFDFEPQLKPINLGFVVPFSLLLNSDICFKFPLRYPAEEFAKLFKSFLNIIRNEPIGR